jgi:DNA-binding GntR family transcriptional regulator
MVERELQMVTEKVRGSADASAVEKALQYLRDQIFQGSLAPAEHVRQEQVAEELGISRVPVREALKVLAAEGLVVHRANQGYFVVRMGANEMTQVYLMRRLLEDELLRSIKFPDEKMLTRLEKLNARMKRMAASGRIEDIVVANREFHLLLAEVRRLWSLSDMYRALYLYDEGARERVLDEHEQLIEALRHQNVDECIRVMDAHRNGSEKLVTSVLGRPGR